LVAAAGGDRRNLNIFTVAGKWRLAMRYNEPF
jgi:hypothetical protein